MIRFTRVLAVTAVALILPVAANALGISIVSQVESDGVQDGVIQLGSSVTFDLVLSNDTGIIALDVLAFGHDTVNDTSGDVSSGLILNGGQVASTVFEGLSGFPSTGVGPNVVAAPTRIFSANPLNPELVRAQLFGGIKGDLAVTTGDGQGDTGIGGTLISGGDVHFRVVFQNSAYEKSVSNISLEFGVNAALGAVAVGSGASILAFNNASSALTVIPEPGTALLMGLGLAGLASIRRR